MPTIYGRAIQSGYGFRRRIGSKFMALYTTPARPLSKCNLWKNWWMGDAFTDNNLSANLSDLIGVDTDVYTLISGVPSPDDVRNEIPTYTDGPVGTLIVGGAASGAATLAKETGANARGGSGTAAKLTPTSTLTWGYWHFYIPATQDVSFTLSFYHRISSAWDGLLKVTIYDTDQTTPLLSSEAVSLIDDDAYHQHTCASSTPTTTGFCLIQIEIKDGSTTGFVYIDDIIV